MKITRELDHEDQTIKVTRKGRKIIIRTERVSVARSVSRQVIEALAPSAKSERLPAIGFESP